jgi:uncharacterized protein
LKINRKRKCDGDSIWENSPYNLESVNEAVSSTTNFRRTLFWSIEMKLDNQRASENVEDRRGRGGPIAVGGIGVLLMALIVMFLGGDPQRVLQQQQQAANQGQGQAGGVELSPKDQMLGEFSTRVLGLTEDVWGRLFPEWSQQNPDVPRQYRAPKMVLFSDQTQSGCGAASAAAGPFYCPADQMVYLDTQFFDVMEKRLKAGGDFAFAYVIAHEVGHHIQKLTGATDLVERARRQMPEAEFNQMSVRLELQADFYAGVMFHHSQKMKQILEVGDIEEGLRAAAAIGDDKLQTESQGYARQETFTHGTSQQRVTWFMAGLKSGDPEQGNTFAIPYEQL